jgi:ribonucleoside-diphosphate reductase beta chain
VSEIQLNDPQRLYRRWEESQWNPFAIDLDQDRAQWDQLEDVDKEPVYRVLASLLVAEERITTKFSGLVGAYGTEEEATFLSSQQVDEARHMQFYRRFQDEVVAEPATVAAHVERARGQVTSAFCKLFDEALVEAHDRLVAAPGDIAAKVRFVAIYHLILESTLGLTTFRFATDYLKREGLLPGFVEGYSHIHHDETRHIGYGVWFLRETVREYSGAGEIVRETLRDLLPSVGEALGGADGGGPDIRRLGVEPEDVRTFALDGLTRRLDIIGVPLASL